MCYIFMRCICIYRDDIGINVFTQLNPVDFMDHSSEHKGDNITVTLIDIFSQHMLRLREGENLIKNILNYKVIIMRL